MAKKPKSTSGSGYNAYSGGGVAPYSANSRTGQPAALDKYSKRAEAARAGDNEKQAQALVAYRRTKKQERLNDQEARKSKARGSH